MKDFDKALEEMSKEFSEMFKEMPPSVPERLFKEKRLKDGEIVKSFGPMVYGYSITIGPDGVPKIRTFGNVKPGEPAPKTTEKREPVVDIITGKDVVRVVAEVPGVEKKDIKLKTTEKSLVISVDTPERKYYKEVELSEKVDPKSADVSYINGVLDVTLKKKS
ncbi:MAG: archaeal heat shock protein Hsp20 [Candidatus Hadarchaeota archaeon]